MPLQEWLEEQLAPQAEGRLNVYARRPGAPNVMVHWIPDNPGTIWFREGTVRAVVYDCIEQHLLATANVEWLPLAEQAYPGLPERLRSDVALHAPGDRWIFVEIKADFVQESAGRDIDKLFNIRNDAPDAYEFGLLLYTMWNNANDIRRWQDRLDGEMRRLRLGRAFPLIRR